jgi:hypothetical protein
MAMAEMIKIMATTINNSISEKPFSLVMSVLLDLELNAAVHPCAMAANCPQFRELYHYNRLTLKGIFLRPGRINGLRRVGGR